MYACTYIISEIGTRHVYRRLSLTMIIQIRIDEAYKRQEIKVVQQE